MLRGDGQDGERAGHGIIDEGSAILEAVVAIPEDSEVVLGAKRALAAGVVPCIEGVVGARPPVKPVYVTLQAAPQQIPQSSSLSGLAHAELAQIVELVGLVLCRAVRAVHAR